MYKQEMASSTRASIHLIYLLDLLVHIANLKTCDRPSEECLLSRPVVRDRISCARRRKYRLVGSPPAETVTEFETSTFHLDRWACPKMVHTMG